MFCFPLICGVLYLNEDFGSAHVLMGLVDEEYNKRILAEIPKVSEKFLEAYVDEAEKFHDPYHFFLHWWGPYILYPNRKAFLCAHSART